MSSLTDVTTHTNEQLYLTKSPRKTSLKIIYNQTELTESATQISYYRKKVDYPLYLGHPASVALEIWPSGKVSIKDKRSPMSDLYESSFCFTGT